MDHASLEDLLLQLTTQVGLSSETAGSLLENLARSVASPGKPAVPPSLNPQNARQSIEDFMTKLPAHPVALARGQGKGIVVCAGGERILRCAWVCIGMLRRAHCHLPVEIWHLGEKELDAAARKAFRLMDVQFVDAEEVRVRNPARILNAWELKPYAILHSSFDEVLLLDADNVPVEDPSMLFSERAYSETGAIFWPDAEPLSRDNPLWEILELAPSAHAAFESGQIVINKSQCHRELCLTVFLNEHSDFFYSHIHGDKDTFHLAWRLLGRPYTLMHFPMERLLGTMCQRDFNGRRLFQHRNFFKWDVQRKVAGFAHEDACWELLRRYDTLVKSA